MQTIGHPPIKSQSLSGSLREGVKSGWGVAGSLEDEFESETPVCSRDIVAKNEKMSYRLPGDQQGSLRSFCATFEGPLNPRISSKVVFTP